MEPWTYLVRSGFETHPEGDPVVENLWVEVLAWDAEKLVGKLVDGAVHTTEWRKGTHVEVDESEINALAVSHEGQGARRGRAAGAPRGRAAVLGSPGGRR